MAGETVRVNVEITHLEMPERPEGPTITDPEVRRAEIPNPALNRFLYSTVGADWLWHSRLGWSHQRWLETITAPGHETWVGYVDGSPAGYFELMRHGDDRVEVLYFGLLPGFIGRGIGRRFLQRCLEKAWGPDTVAVFLNTCSLDHPRALATYRAAGFQIVRTERIVDEVPAVPLEPWPGAGTIPITSAQDHRVD